MPLLELWRFEEPGASDDRVGQLGAGCDFEVVSGTPLSTAGKVGNAISGTDWAIKKTGDLGYIAGLQVFSCTFVYWIRRTSNTYNFGLTLKNSLDFKGFYLAESNGSGASSTAYGGGSASPSNNLSVLNTWTFRAFSWDADTKTFKAYSDIAVPGSVLQSGTATNGSINFNNTFNTFTISGANITLDQLMIYDEVLTPTTGTNSLDQLYNGGAGYDPTALVAASPSQGFMSRFADRNPRFQPWRR